MKWDEAVKLATDAIERCQSAGNEHIVSSLSVSRIGHTDIYQVNWIGRTLSDLTKDEAIGIVASILTPENERPL